MGKKAKEEKTNVMRLLEQAKVEYNHYCYANTEAISGVEVASVLGQNVDKVVKRLVRVGKSGEHVVFVIRVAVELYVKKGAVKQFAIVDGGMSDLIRPALYGAFHFIENLTAEKSLARETYDVVGPICESSDVFAHDYQMPHTQRGDLLALRSAGAYGEIMSCGYNCRPLPIGYVTEDFR